MFVDKSTVRSKHMFSTLLHGYILQPATNPMIYATSELRGHQFPVATSPGFTARQTGARRMVEVLAYLHLASRNVAKNSTDTQPVTSGRELVLL